MAITHFIILYNVTRIAHFVVRTSLVPVSSPAFQLPNKLLLCACHTVAHIVASLCHGGCVSSLQPQCACHTVAILLLACVMAAVSLHCSLGSRLCEERTATAHKRPFGQELVAFIRGLDITMPVLVHRHYSHIMHKKLLPLS